MILRDFIKRYLSFPFTKLEEDVKFKDFQYGIQAIGELYSKVDVIENELTPGVGIGYDTIEDEGVALPQRTTMNFIGDHVTASDIGGTTVIAVDGDLDGGAP